MCRNPTAFRCPIPTSASHLGEDRRTGPCPPFTAAVLLPGTFPAAPATPHEFGCGQAKSTRQKVTTPWAFRGYTEHLVSKARRRGAERPGETPILLLAVINDKRLISVIQSCSQLIQVTVPCFQPQREGTLLKKQWLLETLSGCLPKSNWQRQ